MIANTHAGPMNAGPVAWISADGRSWTVSPIATPIPGCPGRPGPEVGASAAATRSGILLVGSEFVPGPTGCEVTDTRAVTWMSSDGRTWRRFEGWEPEAVWAAPDGWQGLTSNPGSVGLWRSSDGVEWQPVNLPANAVPDLDGAFWAAPDGTTLMGVDASHTGDPDLETLGVVDPHGSWRALDYPASCPRPGLDLIFPPSGSGPHVWAVSDGSATCVSSDLRRWRRGATPVEDACPAPFESWIGTRFGILATVDFNDPGCIVEFQSLSPDGLTWTKLNATWVPEVVADGPAGVIALQRTESGDFTVWKLGQ